MFSHRFHPNSSRFFCGGGAQDLDHPVPMIWYPLVVDSLWKHLTVPSKCRKISLSAHGTETSQIVSATFPSGN